MPPAASDLRLFEDYEVDLSTGELRKAGAPCRIQEKPFRVLAALLNAPGRLVTRDDLRKRIWTADTFVDFDQGINVAVKKLRDVLGDSTESPRFIETVAGKGYRFVAPVTIPSEPLHTPDQRRRAGRLTWGLATFALAVLALTAAYIFTRKPSPPITRETISSIAVLPLANLSEDPGQEYFSDGMTDLLITDLSQISTLKVISRTSVMQYKRGAKPIGQIARELHADAIVEGSVVRVADHVRITAQLIDARSDHHLWAGAYDRPLQDVLALQNEVASAIVREVKVTLTPRERRRLSTARPVNPAAHDEYLRGFYLWNQWEPGVRQAAEHFRRATELDPHYAVAYAGLSDAYIHFGIMGVLPPDDAWGRAKNAALKALELDDSCAEAHSSLAYIKNQYDWDWAASEAEYKRAIDLNPNYATAHHWYGLLLADVKRFDDAITETTHGEDLDPLSVIISASVGRRLYLARHYDEAITQFEKTLQMDPNSGLGLSGLGAAYIAKGRYRESITTLEKAARVARNNPETLPVLGYAYAISGDRERATATLRQLRAGTKDRYVSPYFTALVLTGLGEKDKAIADLQRGYRERTSWMTLINSEPLLDPLRSDPRFAELLRRMNFP